MISTLEIDGGDAVADALAALPELLQAALRVKAAVLSELLHQRIEGKLDGEVLKPRSGALAASVTADVEQTPDGVAITAEAGVGIPYAAIQERGGTTSPHVIVPDKAKALAFLSAGKQVFATIVHHPGSRVPARPYLSSSAAELSDVLTDGLGQGALDAVLQ